MVPSSSDNLLMDSTNTTPQIRIMMQYWVDGLLLQTITYGINITLFSACIYTLKRHVFKAIVRTERFHKRHLLQNHLLTWFSVAMLTLSTIVMIYQGRITEIVWEDILKVGRTVSDIAESGGSMKLDRPLFGAYSASRLLINWGLISFLLWRCLLYWKTGSVFPGLVMIPAYMIFATCIATDILQVIQTLSPNSLPRSTRRLNWTFISWTISTILYYILAILNVTRIYYHRRLQIQTHMGICITGNNHASYNTRFTNYLTIFVESGILLLAVLTAHLVILVNASHLIYIFDALLSQIQVMTALLIVRRISSGRAWTGKTIDCLLLNDHGTHGHEAITSESGGNLNLKNDETILTSMGFNPNTELSSITTQHQGPSQHCDKDRDGRDREEYCVGDSDKDMDMDVFTGSSTSGGKNRSHRNRVSLDFGGEHV